MKPRLKSTPAARELIKAHEPFNSTARQGADGWIVGYGHRAAAKSGVNVGREEAELLLVYDVLRAEQAIDESLGAELGSPQRDALVSFALGIGLQAFRSSAVVRLIRKKRWLEAADAIAAWNGGGSLRHKAERDLFLKDLPEEANRVPVELVIEFDHPSDEPGDVAVEAETQSEDSAPEPDPESELEAEPAPEPEPAPETEAETPAPAPMVQRSALAEQVIMRMRAQLSGPIRQTGYAAPEPEEAEPAAEAEEAETEPPLIGTLGFAFTQSADIDDDEDEIAGETENAEDPDVLPPIVGAQAVNSGGAAGEVSGASDTTDHENPDADVDHDDLPDPSEIDAEFADDTADETPTSWSNGDSKPAPGKNGGHLGEIILLVLGLVLVAGGVWDLWLRADSGEASESNFIGLAALVVGFIFAVGAGIWLMGGRRK